MPGNAKPARKPTARTTIAVQGARVHNLKNVSLELPRDRLIVVTGLSGSGKSSLAFDTIYAEGQRRYVESLSTFAKRFIAQVAKPDVDSSASPVISIKKTTGSNPPTVGTSRHRQPQLLFSTIADPTAPLRQARPSRTRARSSRSSASRSAESSSAPRLPVHGRAEFVFTEVRKKGCRHIVVDGKRIDLSAELSLDEDTVKQMDAVVDGVPVGRRHEKAIKAAIAATLLVGDNLMQVEVVKGASKAEAERFYKNLCSPAQRFVYGGIQPEYFMFNNPESACRTCGGVGVHKITHPELLVPDPARSIVGGCFVKEAYRYNPETWDGRLMYSLSKALKFSSSAVGEAPRPVRNAILLASTAGRSRPHPARRQGPAGKWEGQEILPRQPGASSAPTAATTAGAGQLHMEVARPVMVEHSCPTATAPAPLDLSALHHRRQVDHDVATSTSTTHAFLGSSSPPAAAPMRAARSSARSAPGSSCSSGSASIT
jgi:excinuclease ABC subunit A